MGKEFSLMLLNFKSRQAKKIHQKAFCFFLIFCLFSINNVRDNPYGLGFVSLMARADEFGQLSRAKAAGIRVETYRELRELAHANRLSVDMYIDRYEKLFRVQKATKTLGIKKPDSYEELEDLANISEQSVEEYIRNLEKKAQDVKEKSELLYAQQGEKIVESGNTMMHEKGKKLIKKVGEGAKDSALNALTVGAVGALAGLGLDASGLLEDDEKANSDTFLDHTQGYAGIMTQCSNCFEDVKRNDSSMEFDARRALKEKCKSCVNYARNLTQAFIKRIQDCAETAVQTKECCDDPVKCLIGGALGDSLSNNSASVAGILAAAAGGTHHLMMKDQQTGSISKICEALATTSAAYGATTLGLAAYCYMEEVQPCYDACSQDKYLELKNKINELLPHPRSLKSSLSVVELCSIKVKDEDFNYPSTLISFDNNNIAEACPLNEVDYYRGIKAGRAASSKEQLTVDAITEYGIENFDAFMAHQEFVCIAGDRAAQNWIIQSGSAVVAAGLALYCAETKKEDNPKRRKALVNLEEKAQTTTHAWRQYCEASGDSSCDVCIEPSQVNTPQCSGGPPSNNPGSISQTSHSSYGSQRRTYNSTSRKTGHQRSRFSQYDPFDPTSNFNSSDSFYKSNGHYSKRRGEKTGGSKFSASESNIRGGDSASGLSERDRKKKGLSSFSFRAGSGGGFNRLERSKRRSRFNLRDFLPGGKKDPSKKENRSADSTLSKKQKMRQSIFGMKKDNLFLRNSKTIFNLCRKEKISCSR